MNLFLSYYCVTLLLSFSRLHQSLTFLQSSTAKLLRSRRCTIEYNQTYNPRKLKSAILNLLKNRVRWMIPNSFLSNWSPLHYNSYLTGSASWFRSRICDIFHSHWNRNFSKFLPPQHYTVQLLSAIQLLEPQAFSRKLENWKPAIPKVVFH